MLSAFLPLVTELLLFFLQLAVENLIYCLPPTISMNE